VDEDDEDPDYVASEPTATYAFRSPRDAVAACLEIVQNDEARVPDPDVYGSGPDGVPSCWQRLDPPAHWPRAEQEADDSLFRDLFARRSFESQLPAWISNYCHHDRYGRVLVSLETRRLGEQILDYTHACGMPFRLDGPRFDTRRLQARSG